MKNAQLILASASPRRRELLDQIGVPYRVQVADIDETPEPDEAAELLVMRLARTKAETVWQASDKQLPVLGADTLGSLDGELLQKPANFAEAQLMLSKMSGRDHTVLSAIAVCDKNGCQVRINCSRVWFRLINHEEIQAYWGYGEPRDKAGAYAIQGLGAIFVKQIEGSYSGVMGLPLFETAELLETVGIKAL